MAKSFKNLRAKMSPAAKGRSKEIARELRRVNPPQQTSTARSTLAKRN
jgi:hypothetical protein